MLTDLLALSNGTGQGSTLTVPFLKGYIVLFHGLGYSYNTFRSEPIFNQLELGLASLGYGVRVSDMTGDGPSMASYLQTQFGADDTGANVLSAALTHWETQVADIQSLYPDVPLLAGGISWGGLYALQVAGRATTKPDGYFVHLPAADPNYLTEFTSYGLSSLSDFDEASMTQPGYISYATDDTRVGYTTAETLKAAVGADGTVYTSLGHNTTAATNQAIFEWLRSDPL